MRSFGLSEKPLFLLSAGWLSSTVCWPLDLAAPDGAVRGDGAVTHVDQMHLTSTLSMLPLGSLRSAWKTLSPLAPLAGARIVNVFFEYKT
jgi:hypothetical protein